MAAEPSNSQGNVLGIACADNHKPREQIVSFQPYFGRETMSLHGGVIVGRYRIVKTKPAGQPTTAPNLHTHSDTRTDLLIPKRVCGSYFTMLYIIKHKTEEAVKAPVELQTLPRVSFIPSSNFQGLCYLVPVSILVVEV